MLELDLPQIEACEKVRAAGGGIMWMAVGEGKTRPALLAADSIAGDHTVIVVVARRAAFFDWETEVATLQLPHKVVEIENVPANPVFFNKTIILVSESRLINPIVSDILANLRMSRQIGCIIVDELWLFKNPKAKKSLALHAHSEWLPTIGVSGTVMTARDITDIYGQVAAIGRRAVLARTTTDFKTKYMTGMNAGGFMQWYPKPGAYKQIMDAINEFTYVHMPDVRQVKEVSRIIKVRPTDRQLELIEELKETAAVEGFFELDSMGAVVLKAQQISNGWLESDEEGFVHFPSSKVDRCVALVEEILQTGYKVVVWCAFKQDIIRLQEPMLKLSKRIATLQGGVPFDHVQWNRSDCRICLATEASGSSVNHFAQVPYAVYFSQDYKWTSLQQSKGRHTRRSSAHDTAYYLFLHTEKTLDAQVYYTVRSSANSERSFLKAMDVQAWVSQGKKSGLQRSK